MRFTTLDDWLSWQQALHPTTIDLKLERIAAVWQRLRPEPPRHTVITIGGTNGKGSCVALLDNILRAANYRVGAFTSPHLLRYNERICIDGREADDGAICQAFTRIDAARGTDSLTYFEFGTLAALDLFQAADVDVAIMEVGLGGRLDAVNIVDADAALVVSVDIDHTYWLGTERESIGYEKAGIFRPACPAICADPQPPHRLIEHARRIGAVLLCVGNDYQFAHNSKTWHWRSNDVRIDDLPHPALIGTHQIGNAAAVLMVLHSLKSRLPVSLDAIHTGLKQAQPPGRFQVIPGTVAWILDVAHNPHAATLLAENLKNLPCTGQTHAIIGLMADKDTDSIITSLNPVIDIWCATTTVGARGRNAADLVKRLHAINAKAIAIDNLIVACHATRAAARPGDRIVVLGSFHTVAPVLAAQPWRYNTPLPSPRED